MNEVRRPRSLAIALLACAPLVCGFPALADEATLPASKDNSLYENFSAI